MSKLWVFIKEIIAPCVVVVLFGQLITTKSLIHYLDKFHVPGWQVTTSHRVEQQQLHWQATSQNINSPHLIVVGSSSVFNGLSPQFIEAKLQPKLKVVNLGATNLLGYELYLLQDLILKENSTILYLYNTFSFPDSFHPQSSRTRWSILPGLKLFSIKPSLDGLKANTDGLIASICPLFQYRHLIIDYVNRNLGQTLEEQNYWLDYPMDDKTNLSDTKNWQAPRIKWLADAYQQSLNPNSMSYHALEHFLKLAAKKQSQVILMPVPEPYFNQPQVLAQRNQVDSNIQSIANAYSLRYISRDHFMGIEQDLGLFRDYVHLNAQGAQIYSKYLARILEDEL